MRTTVKELIQQLSEYPPDQQVIFQTPIRVHRELFHTYNGVSRVDTNGVRVIVVVQQDA